MTHVRRIAMENFTVHARSEVTLPERGVVLITGPNGAGKSSFVEAVAFGLWGETLRGTTPWRDTLERRRCAVQTSTLTVERTPKRLTFGDVGEEVAVEPANGHAHNAHPTMKKAQAALDQIIGPFDVWRQSHVFSSADAARFSLATDAERKQLFETVLGLDRFERARVHARTGQQKAWSSRGEARAILTTYEAAVERWQRALNAAEERADILIEPIDQLEARLEEADARQAGLSEECEKLQTAMRQAQRAFDASQRTLDLRWRDRERAGIGTCPTCGVISPARPSLVGELDAQLVLLGQEHEKLGAALTAAENAYNDRRVHIDRERSAWIDTRADLSERIGRARTLMETLAMYERDIANARKELKLATDGRDVGLKVLADAEAAHALEEAAVAVLSPRGVRAHILGRALGGVEAAANMWLGQLGLDRLRVRLLPTTPTASGGSRDCIALEVEGAGGGRGYKAASGGERRRIDLALMLGLAEVSAAAHCRAPGTIWLDECADALDEDGRAAMANVITEMAKERAVVVITHDELLMRTLRPAQHVRLGR